MKIIEQKIDVNEKLFIDAFFERKNSIQEEVINELAKMGFNADDELEWVKSLFFRLSFADIVPIDADIHSEMTPRTLMAKFNLPEFINTSLDENKNLILDNKALKGIENLSAAVFCLATASDSLDEKSYAEFMNFHSYSISQLGAYHAKCKIDMLATLKASLKSISGHKGTIKQKEKIIVFECWEAWQIKPDQYLGDTSFASAMIDKFRPDDPKEERKHLCSVKKITEWCTLWEREKQHLAGKVST